MSSTPSAPNQCFNCGKTLETEVTFCPHCGAAYPTRGSLWSMGRRAWNNFWPTIGILVLGIGAVGALCVGGCAFLSGLAGDIEQGLIGIVLCGMAVFCAWAMIELAKRH